MHADTGLIVCIVGCAAFGAWAVCKPRHTRNLSPDTAAEVDRVGELSGAYPAGIFSQQIPLMDLFVIYLESRGNRKGINRHLLQFPCEEGAHRLEMVCEKHSRIKRLILFNLGERSAGILGLGLPVVSPRVLLRTFGEEQEVVSHPYENCDPR